MSDNSEQDVSQAEETGDVGQWLREKREAAGLSVDAVAAALHLDRSVVEALEREDFAAIGATVFVKGHLRAVAQYLGLDVQEAARRFGVSAGAAAQKPPELIVKYNRPLRRVGPGLYWLAGLLTGLIILLLVWVLWPAGSAPDSGTPADNALADARTPSGVAGDLAPTQAEVARPQSATGNDFESMLSSARESAASATSAPVAIATNEQPAAVTAMTGERGLRLTFNAECWYEVRDANGNRLAMGTAKAGTSRLVTGARPFAVTLGVAEAVELRLDGQPLPIAPASLRGRAARLTIR